MTIGTGISLWRYLAQSQVDSHVFICLIYGKLGQNCIYSEHSFCQPAWPKVERIAVHAAMAGSVRLLCGALKFIL